MLAGQTSRYIYLQLKDFKESRRKDPLMSPMAANLSKKDMFDLAAYYAAQKPINQNSKGDVSKAARGKQVADAALCTMCHLGGLSGQNEVPRVADSTYEYVLKQLKDFKTKTRTNDAGNMTAVLRTIPDEDLESAGGVYCIPELKVQGSSAEGPSNNKEQKLPNDMHPFPIPPQPPISKE